MPAKKQAKSRTSKSKVNNKISAPRWIIAVVLLIVAGTGAFLIYNSFAATNQTAVMYCYQGYCYDKPVGGAVAQVKIVRKNNNCPYSSAGRRWEYLVNGNKGIWQCIR